MLKESKYNVYIKKEEHYLVFNTLYGGLAELSQEEYEGIKDLSSHFFSDEEMKMLMENGFIIKKGIDEFTIFNEIRNKIVMYEKQRENCYTIAVTTECNARCAYCYEKGANSLKMDMQTVHEIVCFIEKNSINNIISNITWFGGEPLVNAEIITYMCDLLNEKGIKYNSSIISNGLLFTPQMVSVAKMKWKLSSAQITLDGMGKKYNAIKNYISKERDPFVTVINNIDALLQEGIEVNIRLNISKDNYDEIVEAIKYLSERYSFQENLFIYPAFISGGEMDEYSEEEKVDVINNIIDILPFYSFVGHKSMLSELPSLNACMRGDDNSLFIDADGSVCRCEHYAGRKKKQNIKEKNWIQDFHNDYTFDEKCKECNFFPRCLGGCMDNRINGKFFCSMDKYIIPAVINSLF